MLRISGTRIRLTRGDTAHIGINLADTDGVPYELQPGDRLVFGMRKTAYSKSYALYRVLPSPELTIEPSDTADLDFGLYRYDVELTLASGEVNTVIACAEFELCPEVIHSEHKI